MDTPILPEARDRLDRSERGLDLLQKVSLNNDANVLVLASDRREYRPMRERSLPRSFRKIAVKLYIQMSIYNELGMATKPIDIG